MRTLRSRLTYANAMATIAVFIALGGSAWAMSANSVGSQQIKRGGVRASDIADNAVSSSKVADGSLAGADFATGALPSGEQGSPGSTGAQGPPGADGAQGLPGADGAQVPAGPPSGAAGGDLSGSYPDPLLADNSVDGAAVGDDTLSGADIDESGLAQVPDAGLLDGKDSKEFARLGGVVNSDGSVAQGTGFTVSRLSAGEYQVAFPQGTLSGSICPPIAVAIPFSGLAIHPAVTGRACSGLGAGSVTFKMLNSAAVAVDTPFLFLAM